MTTYIHKPTNRSFASKTSAILGLGYNEFKLAMMNGDFTIITVRDMDEIILPFR